MVCIPGQIREGWTEEEYANYKSQAEPSGEKRRRVDCEFVAPALQLDPIVVIWRRSMTFFGPLSSRGILRLSALLSYIVQSNCRA